MSKLAGKYSSQTRPACFPIKPAELGRHSGRYVTPPGFGAAPGSSIFCTARVGLALCGLFLAWGQAPVRVARAEPLRVDNPAAEKKLYPEIEEGKKKLAKQDVDGALESFNEAAKAHPDLANGRVQLATYFLAANRQRDGRVHLEKAVVEHPEDPDAYLVMAELALGDRQWTAAGLLADRAIVLAKAWKGDADKKNETLKRAYLDAAIVAQAHDRWEDARRMLGDLLKLAPDDAKGHFRLGQVLFELKKQKEAFAELEAAARMDDEMPSPEATLARMYDKAKDRASAEKWMKMAVSGDPKKLKTRLDVAGWYLMIGDLDEAKAQVAEALKLDENSADALMLAGRIARFAKDYPQAQKYLERAYLEAPGAGAVANELALTLVEMGEDERKRALTLADATYRQTRETEAAATLGWVCYRLGRMDEAERAFNSVASAGQFSPDAIYFFATLADERNRGEGAKPMLEAALKSDGQFAYRAEAQKLYDRLSKKPGKPAKSSKAAVTKSGASKAAKAAAVKTEEPAEDEEK
jgi:tetratricopeptide (TPR) repeat protein